eukprot:6817870-Heterocapsa_arctica.AAC.1
MFFGKPVVFNAALKFATRGSTGIFLGWHLQPGGLFGGEMLLLDLDELAVQEPGAMSRVYTIQD